MDKNLSIREGSSLYDGNVTLELRHGKRTYEVIKKHNHGTFEFFKYILEVAVGGYSPEDRPAYLYLLTGPTGNESTIIPYGILYEASTNVNDLGTSEEPRASIDFTFFVPETVLPSESTSINGIRISPLSSKSFNQTYYAQVDFDSPVTLSANTNLYLTWRIELSNNNREI